MISGKEDLLQSLIEAFLMEKGTHEFYASASAVSAGSEARRVFGELADWEKKHMDYLGYLYQAFQEDRDVGSFEKFISEAKSPVTESGIPVKDLESRIERYPVTGEKGAVDLAMEIEGKAYNLYHRMHQECADTNAKVVFLEMMRQEMKHIDHLKALKQGYQERRGS